MTIEQLKTFLVAADTLNFTATARQLHLSQSAVSQQMKELQQNLGTQLFERRGRSLLLTPAGHTLRQLSSPIIRDWGKVQAEMTAWSGSPQGVLRVGATHTPGVYLLPHAIADFSGSFPGIHASLRVEPPEPLLRLLHEGELDIGVSEQEPAPRRLGTFRKQRMLQDELVLICHPEHRWARRYGDVSPGELVGEPLILRHKGSRTRARIMDGLAQAGIDRETLTVRYELGHTEAIMQAVMAGLGVGFVSRFAIATARYAGLLRKVPLHGVRLERWLWLISPASESAALPHHQGFCDLLLRREWLPQVLEMERKRR